MFIGFVELVPEIEDDDLFGNSISPTVDQNFIHGN